MFKIKSQHIMSDHVDKLSDEQVKEVVKQLVQSTKGYITVNKHSDFYRNLQKIASELGYIEEVGYHQPIILTQQDVVRCVGELWEYVLGGVLAPGSMSSGHEYFFPYLHLTDYGKTVMQESVNPYSTEEYISYLKNLALDFFDSISEIYLRESLKSFKFNCFLGSMVLLGGFSEKIFLNFLDEFISYIQNQTIKIKFEKKIKNKFIATKFNEFLNLVKPLQNQLPKNVKHQLELWLNSFFNYVKLSRNDVGHPTGKEISREEMHAMFLIFPTYLNNLSELLDHFKNNPIT